MSEWASQQARETGPRKSPAKRCKDQNAVSVPHCSLPNRGCLPPMPNPKGEVRCPLPLSSRDANTQRETLYPTWGEVRGHLQSESSVASRDEVGPYGKKTRCSGRVSILPSRMTQLPTTRTSWTSWRRKEARGRAFLHTPPLRTEWRRNLTTERAQETWRRIQVALPTVQHGWAQVWVPGWAVFTTSRYKRTVILMWAKNRQVPLKVTKKCYQQDQKRANKIPEWPSYYISALIWIFEVLNFSMNACNAVLNLMLRWDSDWTQATPGTCCVETHSIVLCITCHMLLLASHPWGVQASSTMRFCYEVVSCQKACGRPTAPCAQGPARKQHQVKPTVPFSQCDVATEGAISESEAPDGLWERGWDGKHICTTGSRLGTGDKPCPADDPAKAHGYQQVGPGSQFLSNSRPDPQIHSQPRPWHFIGCDHGPGPTKTSEHRQWEVLCYNHT